MRLVCLVVLLDYFLVLVLEEELGYMNQFMGLDQDIAGQGIVISSNILRQ